MQELSRLERELESTDVKNKKLIHKATDWYFSPKNFERSGKIYEGLGIKPFKKAIVYVGKALQYPFNRLIGREGLAQPNWPNNYQLWDSSREGLEKFDIATKISETFHLFLGALISTDVMSNISGGNVKDAAITGAAFLGNIYCVMLQRYNRIRLNNAIERMEQKNTHRL